MQRYALDNTHDQAGSLAPASGGVVEQHHTVAPETPDEDTRWREAEQARIDQAREDRR